MSWEFKVKTDSMNTQPVIKVSDLTMRYGPHLVQSGLNFQIEPEDIFVIMGDSGCGKSTLLKHMIGLIEPAEGKICYGDDSLWDMTPAEQKQLMQRFGVLYQKGALWSAMTLLENICLPLQEYTELPLRDIEDLAAIKLSLVGLSGFEHYYPYEISGGMQKRAALARAMALDPEILFFDEPSAGLDPISSRQLDDLILELKSTLKATIVVVTHELPSIFSIATNSIFLDADTKTMIAEGHPNELLEHCNHPKVNRFLTRSANNE